MANKGVQGRIVDTDGNGIGGLVVAAFDEEALTGDTLLMNTATKNDPLFPGLVITGDDGGFSIAYPENEYGLEAKPDIVIRVYDRVKRLIYTSPTHDNVADDILNLPPITIPRPDAEGFAVTLGSGAPQFRSAGNKIEFLIDNAKGWERITQSVQNATTSVHLLQLYFDLAEFTTDASKDIPALITRFDPPVPPTDGSQKPTAGVRLEKELLAISRAPKNVPVRILVNDFILLPYRVDTAGRVVDFYEEAGSDHHVEVRTFRMPLPTPMHAKVIIIDGVEAYLNGSPLVQGYFDDRTHRIDDPRRGPILGLFGSGNPIPVPIHDMNTYIKGPAVADLDAMFCLHWNAVGPDDAPKINPVPAPPAQPENVSLQVLRTIHGDRRISDLPQGETGILEGYLRAFNKAERFIYLENQYFTCEDIADALVMALKGKPGLKLIMVINNKVDIPLYGKWQRKLMQRLLDELPEADRQNRVGFFTAWSHEPASPPDHQKSRLMRNYLHTKVGIVDNVWATVGSTNLDSVGLKTGDHALLFRTLGNFLFLGLPASADAIGLKGFNVSEHRSSELNVAVFNDTASDNATVDRLRRILWSEHLGYTDPNDSHLNDSSAKNWLEFWTKQAAAKLDDIKKDPPVVSKIRILKFPVKNGKVPKVEDPDDYLEALDLKKDEIGRLEIVEKIRSFSFEKGEWD